jgi:hypothetical protein
LALKLSAGAARFRQLSGAVRNTRERRVMGHLVVESEATEPTIGEVKFDLLAQLALEADAVTIANDEHPQHEFGVDRRSAGLTAVPSSPNHLC